MKKKCFVLNEAMNRPKSIIQDWSAVHCHSILKLGHNETVIYFFIAIHKHPKIGYVIRKLNGLRKKEACVQDVMGMNKITSRSIKYPLFSL